MKHSDYLKKKKTRETRKKIISIISAIVVFITTYALVLPAITLDVSKASQEPGIAYEQMQFRATAAAASVTAADSTEEEAQVEEPAAEEPEEEPAEEIKEEEPAETPEEEASAVSDEEEEEEEEEPEEEAPAEPEKEKEEAPEVQEDKSEADSAEEKSSESAPAEAEAADTQKAAEDTAVDQTGTDTAEAATAATEETAAEFKVPELDDLDFDEILTGKTNFYYYHVENAEEAEELSSDSVDDWKKVGSDTVLAPEDFVRVYLSYEIPAGALNETNAVARYKLPAGLELSDKQIKAINKYENGIAASKSGSEKDKYLGAEAIEGSRTPDQDADDEYISATVKVKKNDNGRQELVFTFIPYTVEKNQISYDEKGEVKSKGKEVKGFFTFDLTTAQIDFEKTEKETIEKEDGTTEEIQYSKADVVFVKENDNKDIDEISRTLTMAAPAENEEPQAKEQKTLTSEGADYTVNVSYTEDAQIPDNAELTVREIEKDTEEYASYLEQAKGAVDETKSVNEARFFDITIVADGEKVEPQAPVSVQINFAGIEQTSTDDAQLLHYKESDEVEVMDQAEFSKSEEQTVDTVHFETDGFSVYGIVGTIEKTILTADGETLTVTINYDEQAEIPDGAELVVKEIQEGDDNWGDRSAKFAGVLSEHYGNVTISDARFLEISIMVDGEEFEPKAPVEVKIQYNKNLFVENTQEVFDDPMLSEPIIPDGESHFVMVHYTKNDAEVLESETDETSNGIVESTSKTSSFSEYDVGFVYEYDAPESGTNSTVGTIKNTHDASDVGAMLAEAPLLRAAADGTPEISKDLADNLDGTYQLGLSVTGDAETTATSPPVNVVIVYDVSTSMTGNRIPTATGAYGIQYYDNFDGVSDGNYFQLYKRVGNNYQAITDAEGYTGTVYRRTGGNQWTGYTYAVYNGQRHHASITRADAGEKVVYDFTHALFGYQDSSNPSNIQASLVTFSRTATATQGWTSTESDITNRVSNTGTSHKLDYSGYTNWEAAMWRALQLVNSADGDPTYVVFITDGQPTESNYNNQYTGTNVSGNAGNDHYRRALNEARLVEQAVSAKEGALYSIYAYGKAADWLASLTYYAYNGSRPSGGTEGTTFSTEGYYNASDTDALTAAINEIFSKIVDTLGVGSASIEDGTTHAVETTTGTITELLEVDTGSFQYWLTIPVIASGGNYTFSMPDKVTGDTVNYTATVSGENVTISWNNGADSATYKGKVNAGSLTLEWTEDTDFYNFDPPAASFNDSTGAVDWNLNSVGTLLNDVTYTVTFDVYPSQYTLDLIADLKNDPSSYASLDANIKKYIVADGDDFKLATNTGAVLTYKDTRIDNTERTKDFIDPDPQSTSAAKTVSMSKDWSNILDDREKPEELVMHVTRDGVDRYELVLNDGNRWTDDAWISYGLMTIHEGVIDLKTTGHDYSFSEPAEMEYYWELDVPTLRPMLINAVETMLVKIEESEAPAMSGENATTTSGGVTYYKLTVDGTAEYYKVDDEIANLVATNNRRSYLNVVKKVDETNAPEDAIFPFTMEVVNSRAETGSAGDTDSDYWIWFSVDSDPDPEGYTPVIDADLVSGSDVHRATNSSGAYTGYYYMKSGTSVTVNMKADYSLRFLNLPTDSTYNIVESSPLPDESFTLETITGNRHYKDEEGNEQDESAGSISGDGYGISGTIEFANSDYTMTFDNKYSTIDLKLKKVKEDRTTILGGSTFKLTKESNGTYVSISETLDSIQPGDTAETNPVDLGGLGTGHYRLTETVAPDGYIILTNNVDFEVYKDTDGILKAKLADGTDTSLAVISEESTGNYLITITNTPGAALPNTGGSGTFLYTLGGIVLIMASALMYGFRMRRRERRLN